MGFLFPFPMAINRAPISGDPPFISTFIKHRESVGVMIRDVYGYEI